VVESQKEIAARQLAARDIVLGELIVLLIDKGLLRQGDVIARFEALSKRFMDDPHGHHVVQLADLIRNIAAGETERTPS
jgi:hypothetical protein